MIFNLKIGDEIVIYPERFQFLISMIFNLKCLQLARIRFSELQSLISMIYNKKIITYFIVYININHKYVSIFNLCI